MSIRRPDGEPVGIELFGNDDPHAVLERGRTRPRVMSGAGEDALFSIAMMATPGFRQASARLAVMAVDQAHGILPAGARPRVRGS